MTTEPEDPIHTTEAEARALGAIAAEIDPERLLQFARNAEGRSPVVRTAALRKIAQISPDQAPGTVERACWEMIHAVEALRRLKGRKVWRMNRMRRKIEKDGEVAALEYCALRQTDGFDEIMGYGLPELTAEAIVQRYPGQFSSRALQAARDRLQAANISS